MLEPLLEPPAVQLPLQRRRLALVQPAVGGRPQRLVALSDGGGARLGRPGPPPGEGRHQVGGAGAGAQGLRQLRDGRRLGGQEEVQLGQAAVSLVQSG